MRRQPTDGRRWWTGLTVLGVAFLFLLGGSMQSDLIAEDGGDLVGVAGSGQDHTKLPASTTRQNLEIDRGTGAEPPGRAKLLADRTGPPMGGLAIRPEDRRMAELTGFLAAPAGRAGTAWEQVVDVFRRPPRPDARQLPPMILTHEVGPSDTLWELASRYGTDVPTLLRLNHLQNARRLWVGQRLRVLTVPGIVHQVRPGENLSTIARTYRVSTQSIVEANWLGDPDEIMPGTELILPGATPPPPPPPPQPRRATPARQSLASRATRGRSSQPDAVALAQTRAKVRADETKDAAGKAAMGRPERLPARGGGPDWAWPVEGPISSGYGPRWGRVHEGIDIAVNSGSPVRAAAGGEVTFAGWYGAYGILVIVDHGNGTTTRYAHNSRVAVKVGEQVARGQVLAYSGSTGRSTGPHLHFEIRLRGRPVDPLTQLP